jgi:hypothetical protein
MHDLSLMSGLVDEGSAEARVGNLRSSPSVVSQRAQLNERT